MSQKGAKTVLFYSQEWSVPVWLLLSVAGVLGMTNYAIFQFLGQSAAKMYTNALLVVLLVVLTWFYKRIYSSKVVISLTSELCTLTLQKLVGGKTIAVVPSAVQAKGWGTQAAITNGLKQPAKYWIYLKINNKKYYFYSLNVDDQLWVRTWLEKFALNAEIDHKLFETKK